MSASPEPIPRVTLQGDARARGLAHGEQRREAIRDAIEIYRGLFALPEPVVFERAAHFARITGDLLPELATEIDAIADGAALPRPWIHALNARSELVSGTAAHSNHPGECTAVFLQDHALLGQTWDWLEALEPLIAVLDIRHPDGHRLLTLSEPGIVGKIGLSSAGIGVCLNFLRSPHRLAGLPVHALLRAILDLRDPEELPGLLQQVGHGRSAHILIGQADGTALGMEFTGQRSHQLQPAAGRLTHTNHFLAEDIDPGPGGPSSRARLDQAQAAPGDGDWEHLRRILSSCDHAEHPVCVSWRHMPGWDYGLMGTVCAVAMDLRSGAMEVRRGPDPAGSWQTFPLQDDRLRWADAAPSQGLA